MEPIRNSTESSRRSTFCRVFADFPPARGPLENHIGGAGLEHPLERCDIHEAWHADGNFQAPLCRSFRDSRARSRVRESLTCEAWRPGSS
jgi:hypothetical protein